MSDALSAVQREIQEQGRITFARFMELALFGPGGYYIRGGAIGAEGDYYTAPAAHPLFGALLALQLRQAWHLLEYPHPFFVVEMGAGRGLLAQDIVAYARELDRGFANSLRYVGIDVGPPAEAATDPGVAWVRAAGLPVRGLVGCVLTNEFLDALPVHRFQIQDGRLLEVYVTERDGALAEELADPSTPEVERYLLEQGVRLPDGFRGEVGLEAERWIAEMAGALERGLLLLIDYGHQAEELYSPGRARGTLRCYYRHTLGANPYQRVGQQDITAHVNFSHLMRVGARHGLEMAGLTTQRAFLRNLGLDVYLEQMAGRGIPPRELDANRMAVRQLVKPGGMGDFKVLAMVRGMTGQLHGFHPDSPLLAELRALGDALPVPLRRPEHVPLLEGRYPQAEVEFTLDRLWGLEDEG